MGFLISFWYTTVSRQEEVTGNLGITMLTAHVFLCKNISVRNIDHLGMILRAPPCLSSDAQMTLDESAILLNALSGCFH